MFPYDPSLSKETMFPYDPSLSKETMILIKNNFIFIRFPPFYFFKFKFN
jgi:hypothetical protein